MIVVMGLPGAGKSTVLAIAQDAGWTVLNYGDLMMEIAIKEFNVTDRDSLRKLPASTQKEIQRRVGELLALEKRREVILDTHCSVLTAGGYLPGLPFHFLSRWSVERLVLISAPIEDILARRSRDHTRTRDPQSAESLADHDQMNKNYLSCYSVLTGAPALVLVNRDGGLAEVQGQFRSILQ
ncbi:MAG: adenylate kinase [Candidatus Micrarchaeota archaeon]